MSVMILSHVKIGLLSFLHFHIRGPHYTAVRRLLRSFACGRKFPGEGCHEGVQRLVGFQRHPSEPLQPYINLLENWLSISSVPEDVVYVSQHGVVVF